MNDGRWGRKRKENPTESEVGAWVIGPSDSDERFRRHDAGLPMMAAIAQLNTTTPTATTAQLLVLKLQEKGGVVAAWFVPSFDRRRAGQEVGARPRGGPKEGRGQGRGSRGGRA
ncbi:unnamed protein product [Calypogeia fissa]